MRRRYDLLYAMGALVSSPVLALGLLKTGKWRTDWKGRFGKTPPLEPDPRPTLLLHGVSVGEINATRELVARLSSSDTPPLRLVISATTNTGFDRAVDLYGDRHPVVRFPFDFSWMVGRFLDAIRPSAVALMELEVWPNLAQECRRRSIPLVVINGRLSDASFGNYRWARPLVRPMFQGLAAVGAQTEEYAQRFRELGTPGERVRVTDTMKWDTVELVDRVEGAEELGAAMGIDPERPLVVAGSTGPGEEKLLMEARPPGIQLLLVPRKPERFDEVARLAPGIVRRTGGPAPSESTGEAPGLFLLDTMGELNQAYALADVAFVGRSLVPMGGSDPIQPIALGKPTLMGPHFDNFRDVVSAFQEGDGIRITDDPMAEAQALLARPGEARAMAERGREVIRGRQGATQRHVQLLLDVVDEGTREQVPGGSAPRRRWRRWVLLAFFVYMVLGYLTTAFGRAGTQASPTPALPLPFQGEEVISGVFSVHTNRSHDARGTREQVASAAARAGLDFVVVGDHPPDDRKPGWEFWEPVILEGVYVEGGQELRPPQAGKVLAMGVDTTFKRWEGTLDGFAELLAREEATAMVVHGRGPRESERWVHSATPGMQGWEVVDVSEASRRRLRGPWSLYHLVTLAVGLPLGLGDEALLHLQREGFDTPTVAAFDSLRMRGPLTATAGINVHPKMALGPLLLPPYGPFFRTAVTHFVTLGPLPSQPLAARRALTDAIGSGNGFISMGHHAEARTFRVGFSPGAGGAPEAGRSGRMEDVVPMGVDVPFQPGMRIRAGFTGDPERKILFRLLRNHREEGWFPGPELERELREPGIYRVEVYTYALRLGGLYLRLKPWIFANPTGLRGIGDSPSTNSPVSPESPGTLAP